LKNRGSALHLKPLLLGEGGRRKKYLQVTLDHELAGQPPAIIQFPFLEMPDIGRTGSRKVAAQDFHPTFTASSPSPAVIVNGDLGLLSRLEKVLALGNASSLTLGLKGYVIRHFFSTFWTK
jgi:hypothetical protein